VLLLRRVMVLLALVLLNGTVLAACEPASPTSVASTPTVRLLSPEEIARQVGAAYGEPHAQIAKVMSDVTVNPPYDPLYAMTLTGHFHKGALEAQKLGFSALATRMYVWNIHAYDQAGKEVWFDHELAPASP
jgi:hypothetical protein